MFASGPRFYLGAFPPHDPSKDPKWSQNGTKMVPNWTEHRTKMEEFLNPNPTKMKSEDSSLLGALVAEEAPSSEHISGRSPHTDTPLFSFVLRLAPLSTQPGAVTANTSGNAGIGQRCSPAPTIPHTQNHHSPPHPKIGIVLHSSKSP